MLNSIFTKEKTLKAGKAGLFLLYAFTVLFVLFHHELWQDELHAWIIARELDFSQIVYAMRFEGHFALWHFLLRPFAALGMPLTFLSLFASLLCIVFAFLFIFYGRFPLIGKALILFSCAGLYYYPVVARPYALLGIALYLNCFLYKDRFKRPFLYCTSILFILYIHAYLAGLAGILGFCFILESFFHFRKYENKKRFYPYFAAAFLAAGALACYGMVAPCVGASSVVPASWSAVLQKDLVGSFWGKVSKETVLLHGIGFYRYAGQIWAGCLYWGSICAVLLICLFSRRTKAFWIWFCAVVWMIAMSIWIYPMLMHRAYLPFLLLLYVFCLFPPRKSPLFHNRINRKTAFYAGSIALMILSAMTLPDCIQMVRQEIRQPFSNQEQMADFIKNNIPVNRKIVTFPADLISSTFPAFLPDHHFYNCRTNSRYRVYRKKDSIPAQFNEALLYYYTKNNPFAQEYYMLLSKNMIRYYCISAQKLQSFANFRVEVCFYTSPEAFFPAGEDYLLLKVTPLIRK